MKGKSKNRVRVEKGLFERRKAEKQLRQENGFFSGMKVRIEFDKARALS